jgi:hypothetical protein
VAITAQQAAAKVNALYAELQSRRPAIDKRERYMAGDQPLCYASDEFKKFHGQRFKGWSDNWCEVVGSAAPELTEFAAIHLGDDADDLSDDERALLRDWNVNDGQSQSAQGFLSGAVTSRSFALVWGDDNDEPILTWEHSAQAIVGYLPGTRIAVAGLKAWIDDRTEFATLYTSDEVWKFERARSYVNATTETGLILPPSFALEGGWEMRKGADANPMRNPLGVVPLVEFPNRPVLGKGPISDIEGTMAAQNAINLLWAYLFGAADFASMPARVVLGQEPPKMPVLDENGQKVGEKPLDIDQLTRGRMLWLTGQNTKIGQWDSAKLDVFTGVIDTLVKHVGAQTKTPLNYLGALANVNGETLDGLRIPLHNKVRDGQKHLNSPQREVFRRFALVRGNAGVAEACRTAVIGWKNPETATDAQTSDAALKDKQIGWSAAGILERRYGMSQQEIDKELQRRETEGLNDPVLNAARDLANGGRDIAAGGE